MPNDSRRQDTFELLVVRGSNEGTRWSIDVENSTSLVIGSSPGAQILLSDPEISRRHAEITVTPDATVVYRDLGSTNGSFVNGVRVNEVVLRGGEDLLLGSTSLRFVRTTGLDGEVPSFGQLAGASPPMLELFDLLGYVARSDAPVILLGETGVGKEVAAESIHQMGPRATGPFVVFDCTAVPPNLLESALFGHEKGSFTGASALRQGVFELAHGGTLLIDEIGDLDLALQSRLLRALERSEVQRIGSSRWMRVNVRVIAATRRNLEDEIAQGRFRDDLYYRLAVIRVELPALRERRDDIPHLARLFWRQAGGALEAFPRDLDDLSRSYDWPGNVRELRNVVSQRFAFGGLSQSDRLPARAPLSAGGPSAPAPESSKRLPVSSREAPESSRRPQDSSRDGPAPSGAIPPASNGDLIDALLRENVSYHEARARVLGDFERRYIETLLARHGGNVSRAAAASGLARRYFYEVLNRISASSRHGKEKSSPTANTSHGAIHENDS